MSLSSLHELFMTAMAASELNETNGEDRGARKCTPLTPEFCFVLFFTLGIRSIVIKCYIKCPLKIKKRAYTRPRDATYHQTKPTALQIYNLGL